MPQLITKLFLLYTKKNMYKLLIKYIFIDCIVEQNINQITIIQNNSINPLHTYDRWEHVFQV